MKKDFLAPLTLCASFTCQAGDYFFEPAFNANERYDSNLFMFQRPQQGNWITTLSPSLDFGLRHETGEIKSRLTWNQLLYTNQSELDIDEQLVDVDYKHKTERFLWGVESFYRNQSSLNTEADGSGLLFSQVMSKRYHLAPNAVYSVNERNTLIIDYSYDNVRYAQNRNAINLSDYDYHQISGTLNRIYSERDTLNATVSVSRYSTPVQEQIAYNHVAQLGWQHHFSEQLNANVSAGVNYSEVESTVPTTLFYGFLPNGTPFYIDPNTGFLTTQQRFRDLKNNNFGPVYQASIQKSFDQGSVSLMASQNQTPTSRGLQTHTELALASTYSISERWTAGLSTNYSSNEITGEQNNPFNRIYYSFGANVNWKWTPEINLGLSYTYRQQEFQNNSEPSIGNIVQLQFSYHPQINRQVK
ncbi:hypothetical protein [Methylomicrobium lacus]|uniref:hypothetical protein n=1 Tax=Methylomicrobium lacus TaxID=136992 RepID=UPI0035A91BE1